MKSILVVTTTLVAIGMAGLSSAQTPVVMSANQFMTSQPLSAGHDDSKESDRKIKKHQPLPSRGRSDGHQDEAQQTAIDRVHDTRLGISFPGVGASGYAPPDTNMAVGPNHILQTVNSRYAVYAKNGALLVGPNSLSSLWAPLGSGNGCATGNAGDVVAQYDKLADRFLVTQLGGTSAPYSECIAISQTSDPTGAYWLYSYSYGSTLNDYPKFGVWPTATNSAYLATANLFANGATFTGGQLCAFDRSKMLVGDPSAQGICYTLSGDGGYLPADLDGSTPPLDGTPGYFLNYETLSSLRLYALAPDFANPAASTLTVQAPDIPVASFSEACAPSYTCVPQAGTTQHLDSLGDRLMYRLAFRNFGDHEALVVNHSVASGSSVGVRWYELRAPVSTTGAFSVVQQGTYVPDGTYRWMGSAAMDGAGDLAIGYSASSSSIHPAIRYAGRLPTDPAGTLGAETSMIEGTGSQTGGLSRWGDYSAMRIDPADDCTFWYTNEYLTSNGSFNWSTFFGSFKFAGCGAPPSPDFSLAASPASITLTQGASGTSTITVTALNGFNSSVALSVSGCPPGATCSISPAAVTPTATATLSVSTTSATSTGTFAVSVIGTGGSLTHQTNVNVTVNAPVSPPAAPAGLSATAANAQVSLTWQASTGATSYNVYRGTTSGGPYSNIASTSATSYTDTGLTNGTTYYYVVTAVNSGGESAQSNQASATPLGPPAPPANLTATSGPGSGQISLQWTASADATTYTVKRSRSNGGPYSTIATGVTATAYQDSGLRSGRRYYYVVSAVNASGESANSNQATAVAR